jgi:hypothetical protein
MVKNHSHGAIGANKHGNYMVTSMKSADCSLGHVDESSCKRQKLHECNHDSSAAVDEETVESLLGDEAVTCSATSCQTIRSGLPFSISVEQGFNEDLSHVHRKLLMLLNGRYALTSLDLESNEMEAKDCEALASALRSPACTLTTLNMRRMGVGPENASALAEALQVNSSLTSLNVERNGLGIRGGRALGAGLSINCSLISLDMSLNDVGPEGGAAVASALGSVGRGHSGDGSVRAGPRGG